MRASVHALALLSLALGCASPLPSRVLVVVDTDYAIPSQLDQVIVRVTRDDAAVGATASFTLDASTHVPISFEVARQDALGGSFTVVVEGRLGGELVVEQTVTAQFLAGQTGALHVDLLVVCQGVMCSHGQRCETSGGCEDASVALIEQPMQELDGAVLRPVDARSPDADVPVTPVPFLPHDGASFAIVDGVTPTLRLGWSTISNATQYDLQVGSTIMFSSPFFFSVTAPSYAPNVMTGRYYWHVRACRDAAVCSPWSETRYFDVGRPVDDVDLDGISDIALVVRSAGSATLDSVAVVSGDGYALIGIARAPAVTRASLLPSVVLSDMIGDEHADVSVLMCPEPCDGTTVTELLTYDGAALSGSPTSLVVDLPAASIVDVGDLDGAPDERREIAVIAGPQFQVMYAGSMGTAAMLNPTSIDIDSGSTVVGDCDLDLDGLADMVGIEGGTATIFSRTSTLRWGDAMALGVTCGDRDSDGVADLTVLANYAMGPVLHDVHTDPLNGAHGSVTDGSGPSPLMARTSLVSRPGPFGGSVVTYLAANGDVVASTFPGGGALSVWTAPMPADVVLGAARFVLGAGGLPTSATLAGSVSAGTVYVISDESLHTITAAMLGVDEVGAAVAMRLGIHDILMGWPT